MPSKSYFGGNLIKRFQSIMPETSLKAQAGCLDAPPENNDPNIASIFPMNPIVVLTLLCLCMPFVMCGSKKDDDPPFSDEKKLEAWCKRYKMDYLRTPPREYYENLKAQLELNRQNTAEKKN